MRQTQRRIFLEPLNSYSNTVFSNLPLDSNLTTEIKLSKRDDVIPVWEPTELQFRYLRQCAAGDPQLQFNSYLKTRSSRFPKLMRLGKPKERGVVTIAPKIRANRSKDVNRTVTSLRRAIAKVEERSIH